MYCLQTKDYTLHGDRYAETYKYLEIRLKRCRGNGCKNSTDIDKAIDDLNFNMMAINAYLDFTKYEDPITHFLDEVHFANLDKTRNKKVDIFVMKGEVEM